MVGFEAISAGNRLFSRESSVCAGRSGGTPPSEIERGHRSARQNHVARNDTADLPLTRRAMSGHIVDAPGRGGADEAKGVSSKTLRCRGRRAGTDRKSVV